MGIDKDLEEFFSREIEVVVEDSDKFRMKLGIGIEAFKYLNNAQNLGAFMAAASGGTAAAGMAFVGWYASLGTLAKVGFGLSSVFVATPAVLIAAAGAGGTAAFFLTRKLFGKAKDAAVTEVPNFINSPLDVLAASICDLVCPVLLKIAYSDSQFCDRERAKIRTYFVQEWGISQAYVDGLLHYDESKIDQFDWNVLDSALREIENTGDIKYAVISVELIKIAEEVASADGVTTQQEREHIDRLVKLLSGETNNTNEMSILSEALTVASKGKNRSKPVSDIKDSKAKLLWHRIYNWCNSLWNIFFGGCKSLWRTVSGWCGSLWVKTSKRRKSKPIHSES